MSIIFGGPPGSQPAQFQATLQARAAAFQAAMEMERQKQAERAAAKARTQQALLQMEQDRRQAEQYREALTQRGQQDRDQWLFENFGLDSASLVSRASEAGVKPEEMLASLRRQRENEDLARRMQLERSKQEFEWLSQQFEPMMTPQQEAEYTKGLNTLASLETAMTNGEITVDEYNQQAPEVIRKISLIKPMLVRKKPKPPLNELWDAETLTISNGALMQRSERNGVARWEPIFDSPKDGKDAEAEQFTKVFDAIVKEKAGQQDPETGEAMPLDYNEIATETRRRIAAMRSGLQEQKQGVAPPSAPPNLKRVEDALNALKLLQQQYGELPPKQWQSPDDEAVYRDAIARLQATSSAPGAAAASQPASMEQTSAPPAEAPASRDEVQQARETAMRLLAKHRSGMKLTPEEQNLLRIASEIIRRSKEPPE